MLLWTRLISSMIVIRALQFSSEKSVPRCHKTFLKFWWDQEIGELNERSVISCKLWKEAGRPRSGPIFNRYRSDKLAYRHGIRSRQREKNRGIYQRSARGPITQTRHTFLEMLEL